MPLDKIYYQKFIELFDKAIKDIFDRDMIYISRDCNFDHRGTFKLTYKYVLNDHKIIIENEFRSFDIMIQDTERASNVLYRIEPYDDKLDEENIKKSILLLKKVLEENDYNLYFSRENKIYRKNKEGIKRIKEKREFLLGEIE